MSIQDPRAGDVFFHAKFGGGCHVRVLKRGTRKFWGDSVWVYLRKPGSHITKPTRIWAMKGWPSFAGGLTLVPPEKPE